MEPKKLNFPSKENFDKYKTKVGISNVDIFAPELAGTFNGTEVYVGINKDKNAFLVLPDMIDEDGDKSNTMRYNRDTNIFNEYNKYKQVSDKIIQMKQAVEEMDPIEYHVNLPQVYKKYYETIRGQRLVDDSIVAERGYGSAGIVLVPGFTSGGLFQGGGKKSRRKKSRKSKRRKSKRQSKKKKTYKRRR